MDPGIYKIIHFVGLIILFTGIGSLITSDPRKPAGLRRPAMLHGIGLLLILVSGFGLQAKLHAAAGFPGWIIAKLAILIVLGGFIVVIKRKLLPVPVIYLLVIILGSLAAYLGYSNSVLTHT